MSKIYIALFAVLVAASASATSAEARGGGGHFAIFLAHLGRQPTYYDDDCHNRRKLAAARLRARARGEAIAEAQAEAQARARAKANALALKQQTDAKLAATKIDTSPQQTTTTTPTKKTDLETGSITPKATGGTSTVSISQVCRKFSAAANGLVEIPCP